MKIRTKANWFVEPPDGQRTLDDQANYYGLVRVPGESDQALRERLRALGRIPYRPMTKRKAICPACRTEFLGKPEGSYCGTCQVQLVRILTPNLEATLPPQTPLVFPSCANCGKEYKRHKLIQEGPVLLCESCYELLALLEDDEEPSS